MRDIVTEVLHCAKAIKEASDDVQFYTDALINIIGDGERPGFTTELNGYRTTFYADDLQVLQQTKINRLNRCLKELNNIMKMDYHETSDSEVIIPSSEI